MIRRRIEDLEDERTRIGDLIDKRIRNNLPVDNYVNDYAALTEEIEALKAGA